jgi:hypothetical protein
VVKTTEFGHKDSLYLVCYTLTRVSTHDKFHDNAIVGNLSSVNNHQLLNTIFDHHKCPIQKEMNEGM